MEGGGEREGGRGREGEKEGRKGGRRLQIALNEGVMFLTRDEVMDNCCFWSESDRRPCLTATATYTHIIQPHTISGNCTEDHIYIHTSLMES